MVSAIRERLLSENLHKYITPKVPINETGTAMLGMKVARGLPRNKNTTRTTREVEMTRVFSTSCSEALIVGVLSIGIPMSIAAGIEAFKTGRVSLTRSTVAMIFAPGWRNKTRRTAGFELAIPPFLKSSTESITCAISPNLTGALL
jgi:hypothetical protein